MEMFQPNLTLAVEPDGEYTLHAVVLTPNSCYSAGRAKPGIPPMVRLTAETFSVLLPLRVRGGPCLMVLTPVRFRLRNLELGPRHGKTNVIAFTMNGDQMLGSASIPVTSVQQCPQSGLPLDSTDWAAWVNRMPPGPASFHVTGTVVLPTPGYSVELVAASPQGSNPADLILDLRITERPGVWPQVITPMTVRYDVTDYKGNYQSVLVRQPNGESIQIPVEEAF